MPKPLADVAVSRSLTLKVTPAASALIDRAATHNGQTRHRFLAAALDPDTRRRPRALRIANTGS